ncbi:unnamed protein product [Tilletia laevis]|nr:unnamed protein product [Tilletia laevis]CAD6965260.1 unnamed protein product [Tilletia laevis]CAD6968477.1 unnamed protein product [Tilletia controversa]
MTARGKELITHLGVMNRDIQLQVFKYSLRFFSAANQPPLSQARRFSAQNLDRHIHASTLRCRRRERPLPHQRPRSQRFKVNCLYTAVVP